MIRDVPLTTDATRLSGCGTLIAALVLGTAGSTWAPIAGGAVVLTWLLAPAAYVVAIAHLLYPIAFGPELDPLMFASFELGLIAVLIGATTTTPIDYLRFRIGRLVVGASLLGIIGWAGIMLTDEIWVGAAAIVTTAGLAAYILYRYELVHISNHGDQNGH